ncbi:DUF6318 family protein [Neomicrococcus lactis]
MPKEAKEHSAKGLEAFTRYWFSVADYSQKTSDTRQMMSLCFEGSEFCAKRKQLADQYKERKSWPVGGEATIGKFYTQMKTTEAGYTHAILELRESSREIYNSNGIDPTGSLKASKSNLEVYSIWQDDAWKFVTLAQIKQAASSK